MTDGAERSALCFGAMINERGRITMERDELLRRVTILEFMAIDLQLYLDTHPDDADAIENYKVVITESKKARDRFEKYYGPLCASESLRRDDYWAWIDSPWPWEEKYNFKLRGRGARYVDF
jgi:spore coat protein JB